MPYRSALRSEALPLLRAQGDERRRHHRVALSLLGRYMLANRHEFPCQTRDMSPGGVALFAPTCGDVGERVVLYLDRMGRIEGHIARPLPNGFAMAFSVPTLKRERLAEHLTWIANRTTLGLNEDRDNERTEILAKSTLLRLTTGAEIEAQIIDVSLSGLAVRHEAPPPIGTRLVAGRTPGRVVRHLENGMAIEFLGPVTRLWPTGRIDF